MNLPFKLPHIGIDFLESVGLRVISLFSGLFVSIWVARTLGPEKLGISTLALALATQASIFVVMNQDPALIRLYLNTKDLEDKRKLVVSVLFFRGFCWVVLAVVALMWGIWSGNVIPVIGGILIGFSFACPSLWLLQSHDSMIVQIRLTAIQQVLMCLLVVKFINQGSVAGVDLLLGGVVACITLMTSWYLALRKADVQLRWSLFSIQVVYGIIRKGRWLLATGLAVYCYTRFEQPLIGLLAGVEELGLYRTAFQVSSALAGITGLIPLILYSKFIRWEQQGKSVLWGHQKRIGSMLALLGVVILVIAYPLVFYFYPIVFSAIYAPAAWPAFLLITSQVIIMLNGVFCWGLWAQAKDHALFWLFLGVAILSLLGNILSVPRWGMMGAASVNLLSECLILVGSLLLSKNKLDQSI